MSVLETSLNQNRPKALFEFTQGIDLDTPLAASEIKVQKAWAKSLCAAGYVSKEENLALQAGLAMAQEQIELGKFEWRVEDEDIHMNLERFLTQRLGGLGKKIHYGRSRNDLIATTLRLHVSSNVGEVSKQLVSMIEALLERASEDIDVIVPGLTHLQFGQPVRLSMLYLSYAWAFQRDLDRLQQLRKNTLAVMPLGSGPLAGTHLDLDLSSLAGDLGFSSAPKNAYDSVGDRDFILEALQVYSSVGIHLSRLAEDCIFWSSTACGWLNLPPDWSTGSSIMPNKRNPDVPELVRGKAAQIIGAASSASLLLKGMPGSYSSDLHELKRIYLSVLPQLHGCLGVFPSFLVGLKPNLEKVQKDLQRGHLLATEIANQLVASGLSFREAYQKVAELVAAAEQKGLPVHRLEFSHANEIAPCLQKSFFENLTMEKAVEAKTNAGGSAKAMVLQQMADLKKTVATAQSESDLPVGLST